MKYYLKNEGFRFVKEIELLCQESEIVDITVGASKVDQPKDWDYPAFRLESHGEWIKIKFHRPDNWSEFEITVFSRGSQAIAGKINYLEPASDEQVNQLLKTKKIIFLGTARSCATKIAESINRIFSLAENFADYRIEIFENDSEDHTLSIIQEMVLNNPRLSVVTESGLDQVLPGRTQRLAYARNKLLDRALISNPEFDYICWADLDGLVDDRFSTQGFLSNFMYESVWDAVFPITYPIYYDVWALREKTIAPNDVAWDAKHRVPSVVSHGKNLHAAVQQLAPGSLTGWLSVESAFGGFAIYKNQYAGAGRYVGTKRGEEICEHVIYNKSLIHAGARLYINPECITYNP
jgi:hypothetical protein